MRESVTTIYDSFLQSWLNGDSISYLIGPHTLKLGYDGKIYIQNTIQLNEYNTYDFQGNEEKLKKFLKDNKYVQKMKIDEEPQIGLNIDI